MSPSHVHNMIRNELKFKSRRAKISQTFVLLPNCRDCYYFIEIYEEIMIRRQQNGAIWCLGQIHDKLPQVHTII